jgi:uncharacterized protein
MAITQVEQDNLTAIRRGFEAFNVGDMATLSELFDRGAAWYGPAVGILQGHYAGRDAIFAMFAQIGTETGGTFRAVPSTFAGSGDKVFAQAIATGSRNGRTLESDEVIVFTLTEGKVREARLYFMDYAANVAFWS